MLPRIYAQNVDVKDVGSIQFQGPATVQRDTCTSSALLCGEGVFWMERMWTEKTNTLLASRARSYISWNLWLFALYTFQATFHIVNLLISLTALVSQLMFQEDNEGAIKALYLQHVIFFLYATLPKAYLQSTSQLDRPFYDTHGAKIHL